MKKSQNKWALLSLLGIAALLVGGFWLAYPRADGVPHAGGTPGLNWYKVQMFADQSGWAVTSRGVMRTQDAGAHWTIVSPPDFTDTAAFIALTPAFLDGRHAWVILPSGTQYIQYGKKPPENAQVFHTADGGKTWQKSDLPDTASTYTDARSGPGLIAGAFSALSPLGENRRTILINQIVALDARTVWVAVSSSNVHTGGGEEIYTHIYSRLWRSSDGGQTWEKAWENTDPAFPNGSGAWLAFTPSGSTALTSGSTLSDLLLTRDGIHWQQTVLPVQDMSSQALPFSRQKPAIFFNRLDGVIALLTSESVTEGETQYTIRFFLTHDGGRTWQKSGSVPLLQFNAGGNEASLLYLDRTHWLITGPDVLLRSDDAGQTWQRDPLTPPYRALTSPSFVSPLEGWVIGQSLNGKIFTGSLLHTNDGGKTWALVDAQVGT